MATCCVPSRGDGYGTGLRVDLDTLILVIGIAESGGEIDIHRRIFKIFEGQRVRDYGVGRRRQIAKGDRTCPL